MFHVKRGQSFPGAQGVETYWWAYGTGLEVFC
jgi:hypothetical protein